MANIKDTNFDCTTGETSYTYLDTGEQAVVDAAKADYEAGQAAREAHAAIQSLEASVTPRRLREAIADPTWINAQEALIAIERAKL